MPHSPQNFSAGSFSAPHDGQRAFKGAPHSAQNFRPSRFSTEHFEQCMAGAQLIEKGLGVVESTPPPSFTALMRSRSSWLVSCHFIDRRLGPIHVKLQTWFPFPIQVHFNGHEWLARRPHFGDWVDRLEIFGLDLRHSPSYSWVQERREETPGPRSEIVSTSAANLDPKSLLRLPDPKSARVLSSAQPARCSLAAPPRRSTAPRLRARSAARRAGAHADATHTNFGSGLMVFIVLLSARFFPGDHAAIERGTILDHAHVDGVDRKAAGRSMLRSTRPFPRACPRRRFSSASRRAARRRHVVV